LLCCCSQLQAHGHTNDRNSELSFEQDADDVACLLEFLKIEKADIFGFSEGRNIENFMNLVNHPGVY
jgi:pimeloyl-ACP methyl ester carboxylesterase